MTAPPAFTLGIDLGGTKIETQVFDADWHVTARRRRPTPTAYEALLDALAEECGDAPGPIGVSAAGLLNPATGLALTANLPATGHPIDRDLADRIGRPVTWVNDCRALVLSEAVFGAGRGRSPVLGIILGTGVGAGLAVDGALIRGHAGTGGEIGHIAAPAHLVVAHGLPIWRCGCGRQGCAETYLSGPSLLRMAQGFGAPETTTEAVVEGRSDGARRAWGVWLDLLASLIATVGHVADPALVVLGGGLSNAPGLIAALRPVLAATAWDGFRVPDLALAEGGDASGARGAAWAAVKAQRG